MPLRVAAALALFISIAIPATAQIPNQPPVQLTDPSELHSLTLPGARPVAIEKLYTTRTMAGSTLSPDGQQVAFVTNISGRFNVWTVAAASGWPRQLTVSNERQMQPSWSPDGAWIAYASDYGGNEQWDLFLVSPRTGEVINLTNTPDVAELAPHWSPDSRYLAFSEKAKTGAAYEIRILDLGEHSSVRPCGEGAKCASHSISVTTNTPPGTENSDPVWSPDSKRLAFTRGDSGGHASNVLVFDLATAKTTNETQAKPVKLYRVTDWSPGGKRLLLTSNAGNGYSNIAHFDLASGALDWLSNSMWESEGARFSPDGNRVVWQTNVDGNIDVTMLDLATRRAQTLPLPKGLNTLPGNESPFTRDSTHILFAHSGPNSPNDVWIYSLSDSRARQVTDSLVGGLSANDLIEPQLVHYRSTDNKWSISAFVYVPHNLKRDGTNPAVVMVHGGPTGQTTNSFQRMTQYLVTHGYIVIAPNVRGSSGYGTEFQYANRRDWGGGDLQDVVAATDWLKRTGYVDAKKLVIMGASYGGYMTMMGLTKTPQVWAAGVSIVPFVSLFTEFQNEDPGLREYDRFFMGDPEQNRALWEDRSPINFVDRIKAPVLVIAGGNDPRDPPTESIQLVERIRQRGGIAELKIYADEGHGFSRLENQIDEAHRIIDFLNRYAPTAKP